MPFDCVCGFDMLSKEKYVFLMVLVMKENSCEGGAGGLNHF